MIFTPTVDEVLKSFTKITTRLEKAIESHRLQSLYHQGVSDTHAGLQKVERAAADKGTKVLNNIKNLIGE